MFGEIYTDCPKREEYIISEQQHTKFNLNERIKPLSAPKVNQILIEFDGLKFNNNHISLIYQMPEIIANSGQIGTFDLDIFKLDISEMYRYDSLLIKNTSVYYQGQLL